MQYPNLPVWHRRPTLEQWFANPFVQPRPSNHILKLDKITLLNTILSPNPDKVLGPLTDQNTLLQVLHGSTQVRSRIHNKNYQSNTVSGAFMIVPRLIDFEGSWESSFKAGFLHFPHSLLVDLIAPSYQGDPEHIEFSPKYDLHDLFLRNMGSMLYHELETENLFGPLFAEMLVNTIVLHLIRNYSNITSLPKTTYGKLTLLQLRIVDEYIHTHLSEKISLSDLARSIHVSIPQFERAFRATLHRPPYRYVLERRIEGAKALLTYTHLTLVEIALECGFANQSHMTRHFTKMVGVTPAQFMRHMRKGWHEASRSEQRLYVPDLSFR